MREMDPRFEPFDIPHVGVGDWIVGETREFEREFENTGNKARMLMKTKDITFLNVAKRVFGAPLGTSQALKGVRNTGKRGKAPKRQGEAGRVTISRLREIRVCLPSADNGPGAV